MGNEEKETGSSLNVLVKGGDSNALGKLGGQKSAMEERSPQRIVAIRKRLRSQEL